GLVLAIAFTHAGMAAARQAHLGRAAAWLWAGAALGLFGTILFALLPGVALPPAISHAYAATATVLFLYVSLHAAIGTSIAAFVALRCSRGFVSPARMLEPLVCRMWWTYTGVSGLVVLGTVYGMSLGAQ